MEHEELLQTLVDQLKAVSGVKAIVLGGSYAAGVQRPDSDLDIGLYYLEDQPLDIERIRILAASLSDTPEPIVTELGGWGPWVNGGAWLTIGGQRVDFLYRNINFVSATLDECNRGRIRSDYWQQPAYGFHNFIYCAEIAFCRPLYDPEHVIEQLKEKVVTYSPALQKAIVKTFLWSARFTLDNTKKAATRGEVYIVTGCLARAIHSLVQVMYALNKTWYISEKRLVRDVVTFTMRPEQFVERIYAILGNVGSESSQLQASLELTEELYQEVATLCEQLHGTATSDKS